jgi:hypothetical protein
MVQTKKMNESFFANILKEFNAVGELIRARQDEKQAVIDEFNSESKRFFFGKISERALASSVKKTNKEFQRLDGSIREAIAKAGNLATQARKFVSAQSPKTFKATLSGISGEGKKKVKKKRVKKKSVKRKIVKKKRVKKKPVKKKRK